ncbi:uncharacterized protein SCHCODRAFT_02598748 [Schizophyllum commune H4-8]|uniref:BTB domain-containing protein n=1 Tax=Schizophyllum commune (strain H4-8 / FGSC 9210) TaxID=578458 RepID=D8QMA6_SCHCM|nr:uncharacterized protein SCHCODRAFT_02598748 [Schizophyllum commune H4-8]KAI5892991.1 hypothetical protein SCHCODRAFT_02598748 [Schizophyllum commune H4-8]
MVRYTSPPRYQAQTLKVCERFSAGGTVCFESADNVIFHVDGRLLPHHAPGFPATSVGDAVSLAEDAETLEHLLRIVYQEKGVRPPDTLPFDQLVLLAEAAEKYQAYAASMMCRLAMKSHGRTHTLEVMEYAARSKDDDVLDDAATFSVGLNPKDVYASIPGPCFAAWVLYTDQHSTLMRHMTEYRYAGPVCSPCVDKVVRNAVLRGPEGLVRLEELFTEAVRLEELFTEAVLYPTDRGACTRGKSDTGCREYLREWKARLERAVERVEPMSSFLS